MNHFYKNSLLLFGTSICLVLSFTFKDELFTNYLVSNSNPYIKKSRSFASSGQIEIENQGRLNLLSLKYTVKDLKKDIKCISNDCESKITINDIRDKILKVYDYCLKNNYQDQSIENITKNLIGLEDRKIKEAAFLLLTTQKPSNNNLSLVIENALKSNDPNLVGLSIMELDRYQKKEQREKIVNAIKGHLSSNGNDTNELIITYAKNYLDKDIIGKIKQSKNKVIEL